MTNQYINHQFKEGVRLVLSQHFSPSIVDGFEFVLEVERYVPDDLRTSIRKQIRDNNFIMEVYYRLPNDLVVYICDVASWWSKNQVEFVLLGHITDKIRIGDIGKNWYITSGHIISEDIKKGKFETHQT